MRMRRSKILNYGVDDNDADDNDDGDDDADDNGNF